MTRRLTRLSLLLLAAAGVSCTTPPNSSTKLAPKTTAALLIPSPSEVSQAHELATRLTALSPTISPIEAEEVARCAYRTARELTIAYSIVGPAIFHNFLINIGAKKRGLCYQWAQDLISRLDALHPKSMELRWGVAHPNSIREHNCVVITAHGQAFEDGILLDCWRNAGRLYYGRIPTDRYPWHEEQSWDWRKYTPAYISP